MFNIYSDAKWELTNSEDIYSYISGGEGVVTLQSPSGVHKIYAFNKPRCADAFPKNVLFVYVQSSKGLWIYVGMWVQGKGFYVTRASIYKINHPTVKGVKYIINMAEGKIKDSPMKLYHCGVCSICGRRLTSPKSIAQGIGPKCKKYVSAR